MNVKEFAQEVADHGIGADCNPTVWFQSVEQAVLWYSRYLHRIDRHMRVTAKLALDVEASHAVV